MVTFVMLTPGDPRELLGYIPAFLHSDDPRPAREQINARYTSRWAPFEGFSFNPKTYRLTYPGDPPMMPVAMAELRNEKILVYPSAWVLIVQPDGSFEVSKID